MLRIMVILCTGLLFLNVSGQGEYLNTVGEVSKKLKTGETVALKGTIVMDNMNEKIALKDDTGTIKLLLQNDDRKEVDQGDMVTVDGEVVINDGNEKEIRVSNLHKHKYIEEPWRCCKPSSKEY